MIVKHNPQVIMRRIEEEQLKNITLEKEEVELLSLEEEASKEDE